MEKFVPTRQRQLLARRVARNSVREPDRLYDLFEGPDALLEPAFVDAINANLRRGRILMRPASNRLQIDLTIDTGSSSTSSQVSKVITQISIN